MDAARAHLETVTREGRDPVLGARRLAAHKRAAQDRVARLDAALAQLPEVVATKKKNRAKDAVARVSTTDPDARVMKMGDGGFRPAYNEILIDGGYTKHDAIDEAAALGVTVVGPVPKPRVEGIDPHAPHSGDSPPVAEWRARMATDAATLPSLKPSTPRPRTNVASIASTCAAKTTSRPSSASSSSRITSSASSPSRRPDYPTAVGRRRRVPFAPRRRPD